MSNIIIQSKNKFERFQLLVKESKIEGLGAYALSKIPARVKIGELAGNIISIKEARAKAATKKRIAIVEFDNKLALDATDTDGAIKYINHSCNPNSYIRVAHNKVEFYSLREIKKGEELSANYGETHHDGKLKCNCGAKNCKGFL
jgi:SET domain-containing protein